MDTPWWQQIRYVAHTRSTMRDMADWAAKGGREGDTLVAATQSAGVGRHGRSWHSPHGGLYMTTLLWPKGASALSPLSLVAGLAVWRTLRAHGLVHVRLKWPNDIMVGQRKLAGVLLHTQSVQGAMAVLVGIGLNLAGAASLGPLTDARHSPIGLADLMPVDDPERLRQHLARGITEALQNSYALWQAHGDLTPFADELRLADALRGHRVRGQISAGRLCGVAAGIEPDGGLSIRVGPDVKSLSTGEVERVFLAEVDPGN